MQILVWVISIVGIVFTGIGLELFRHARESTNEETAWRKKKMAQTAFGAAFFLAITTLVLLALTS